MHLRRARPRLQRRGGGSKTKSTVRILTARTSRRGSPLAARSLARAQRSEHGLEGLGRAQRSEHGRPPHRRCPREHPPADRPVSPQIPDETPANRATAPPPIRASADPARSRLTSSLRWLGFAPQIARRGDRVAEGTRLLSGRRSKAYRGFESRPLRNCS
jgi:hypothetical protein